MLTPSSSKQGNAFHWSSLTNSIIEFRIVFSDLKSRKMPHPPYNWTMDITFAQLKNDFVIAGPNEESILLATVADCTCKICCAGQGEFFCAVLLDKFCHCNQHCRTSNNYNCCNNETICDSGTVVPPFTK